MRSARLIRTPSRRLAILGLAALVVLSLTMMADILGRELLGEPIPGFSDVFDLTIIIAAAACFPASLANNQHVAVRFGGLVHWRVREALDLFGHLVMLAAFSVIAWQLGVYALEVRTGGQTTWLLGIPVWPVWSVAAVLFVVCVPVQIVQVLEVARRLLAVHRPAEADDQVRPRTEAV